MMWMSVYHLDYIYDKLLYPIPNIDECCVTHNASCRPAYFVVESWGNVRYVGVDSTDGVSLDHNIEER